MSNNYDKLISKIDAFIRKYYTNLLIRGLLISVAIIISFFLILDVLEHFFRLRMLFRASLFYIFIITTGSVLLFWVIIPLLKLISFGKRISHEQAAKIIGIHFPDVSDSLLNTLQLKQLLESKSINQNILEASIDQRAERLSPISFKSAISFSFNKKYLKFTLPPIVILIFLLLYSPKVITEPSQRIINYDVHYEEKAPFQFEIENESLKVIENDNFTLNVKITGDIIPEEVFIVVDGYPFKAVKTSNINLTYTFNKVRKNKSFHFQSGKYTFNNHTLKVLPKPTIIDFTISIDYPVYTGKKDEIVNNIGDLIIPEGSKIQWVFNTRDTRKLELNWAGIKEILNIDTDGSTKFSKRLINSTPYQVVATNEHIIKPDTINYIIDVVKDAYPMIRIEEFTDSINDNIFYFRGFIKDDYGFNRLSFIYNLNPSSKEIGEEEFKEINVDPQRLKQDFFHLFDLKSIDIKPGDEITYYFQVWDNDKLNGYKSSKSKVSVYKVPSKEELDMAKDQRSKDLQNQMTSSMDKAQQLNKQVEKLSKKLAEKKQLDWQDKEALKDLLDEYNKLLKDLEKIQKQNETNQEKDQIFSKEDERLLEKQDQINNLMDKLLTPEMKEMMQELQKMMEEEMKKDDAQDILDKMKLENEDIEKQLDRDLEILKQMDFDLKLQEAIDKLKELQKKQEELSKKSSEKGANSEEIKKEQEALNKEFEDFEKKMEETKKANESLEEPNKLEDTKAEQEGIKNEQQQSSDELSKGKKGSASKMQKKASESMKKLSEKLEEMQSDMEMESTGEDIESLRDILSNLVESSFNQEELMKEVRSTSKSDPKYPKLIHRQKQIWEDMKMIEDSLLALSKRQPSIAPVVNKEVSKINSGISQSVNLLLDINTIGPTSQNQKNKAVAKQQYAMTSMNNLALMLAETLEQMQQQMQQQKSGKGSCKKPKPGQGKGSMKSIRQMQQALNKKMKEMQQQMKNGKSRGNKQGKHNQGQGEKMSEEMARMAAQQEAIRKKLQEYQNELKKQGRGEEAKGLNGTAKRMEENETELVNKIIRAESMMRQQEIETRLLEAEEAERKRGEEEKRESKEGVNPVDEINQDFFDYIRKQNKEVELLKTIPPKLKPFYKNKVNKYFEDINQEP